MQVTPSQSEISTLGVGTPASKLAAQQQALDSSSRLSAKAPGELVHKGASVTLEALATRRESNPDALATLSTDEQYALLVREDVIPLKSTAAAYLNRVMTTSGQLEQVSFFTSKAGNTASFRPVYAAPQGKDYVPASDTATLKAFLEDLLPILKKYRKAPGIIFKGLKLYLYCDGTRNLLPPWQKVMLGHITVNQLIHQI